MYAVRLADDGAEPQDLEEFVVDRLRDGVDALNRRAEDEPVHAHALGPCTLGCLDEGCDRVGDFARVRRLRRREGGPTFCMNVCVSSRTGP